MLLGKHWVWKGVFPHLVGNGRNCGWGVVTVLCFRQNLRVFLKNTVGFREVETTVFDPANVFLSTH